MKTAETTTWDFLQLNLEDQIALYGELVAFIESENNAIINNRTDELNQFLHQQTTLTQELENKKTAFIGILSQIFIDEDPHSISLEMIVSLAPIEVAGKIKQSQKRLRVLAAEFRKCQILNQRLIQQSLSYVRHMMNQFATMDNRPQNIYGNHGRMVDSELQSNLMNVVA
jgi:hypothetical protein